MLHCLHLLLPLRLAVDGVFEEGGEEEETDELVGQVLDEIGINLNASLVSAPGQKVAAAAPAAAAQQPVAQPMGAAEGERAGGGWVGASCWLDPCGHAAGTLAQLCVWSSAHAKGQAALHPQALHVPTRCLPAGGGGTAPGLDDDLQARLDRLRKS